MHFPEELTIMSYGSGYGGNALLGKKCHALRIASYQARTEGWLAEHMLIVGVAESAGRDALSRVRVPVRLRQDESRDADPAREPEGLEGLDARRRHRVDASRLLGRSCVRSIPRPATSGSSPARTRRRTATPTKRSRRTRFSRTSRVTADNDPWWEEKGNGKPTIDWVGRAYDGTNGPAAHPNSRFTVSAKQNPAYSKLAEAPEGVPISALVFGGRRRELAPLVYQAKDWAHGVLVGASVASETTAAATGKVGVVRRDPMAMKPFCGYNYGDYWAHWLSFAKRSAKLPKIFHVNWFRRDSAGRFLWPGFGENLRVLRWIIERCENRVGAVETPIGYLPKPGDIDVKGLDVSKQDLELLLAVDPAQWRAEMDNIGQYFDEFGDRVPGELRAEHKKVLAIDSA